MLFLFCSFKFHSFHSMASILLSISKTNEAIKHSAQLPSSDIYTALWKIRFSTWRFLSPALDRMSDLLRLAKAIAATTVAGGIKSRKNFKEPGNSQSLETTEPSIQEQTESNIQEQTESNIQEQTDPGVQERSELQSFPERLSLL
ncbi:hypothetical protein NA57DRAFT_51015 [Rhizodiscina lignyota]|uniref:Uncharacterized protein n=1 Tax=Rhizodiscina lignyota TaxID=1504668 RepID=A0A9P4MG48_9PEZI|nr:hypothetical protein NA57DRAFT_51015 [Rhizodiscina lignyota]